MSIPVELRQLDAATRDRGPSAYVLTVSDLGAPHVVHAQVVTDGERLIAADAIATVDVTGEGARLLLAPTRAVLHRPAPASDPLASPCGSDCIPVSLGGASRAGSS